MDGPMAPAAYVAEDGLVGHQWEEKPSVLSRLDAAVQGDRRGWVGERHYRSRRRNGMKGWDWGMEGNLGKGITF